VYLFNVLSLYNTAIAESVAQSVRGRDTSHTHTQTHTQHTHTHIHTHPHVRRLCEAPVHSYIGLAKYTVYDRIYGDFPARYAIYTPYIYGSSQPYSNFTLKLYTHTVHCTLILYILFTVHLYCTLILYTHTVHSYCTYCTLILYTHTVHSYCTLYTHTVHAVHSCYCLRHPKTQSPLSFGGFGAMTRHVRRLDKAISEALASDALSKAELGLIHA
jgi:hypothetical protein